MLPLEDFNSSFAFQYTFNIFFMSLFCLCCSNILISHTYEKHFVVPVTSVENAGTCLFATRCAFPAAHESTHFINPQIWTKDKGNNVIHLFFFFFFLTFPPLGSSAGSCCCVNLTFTVTAPLVKSHCFSFPVKFASR